jgi:hypothetical protein
MDRMMLFHELDSECAPSTEPARLFKPFLILPTMRIPMQHRMISSDRDSDASVDGGESSIETGHDVGKEEDDRDEVKEIQKLAKRETRNIKVWRSIVVLLLLAVGASVSTLTFIFLRDEETDDYVDAVSNRTQTCVDCELEMISRHELKIFSIFSFRIVLSFC